MRESKFRGKSIGAFDKGEWRYGYLMQMHQPHRLFIGKWQHIGGEATIKDELFSSYEEVDPETVGQFTDKHDRNGVEIYEGDIVPWSSLTLVVEWNDRQAAFNLVRHEPYTRTTMTQFENLEVIGNIHGQKEEHD